MARKRNKQTSKLDAHYGRIAQVLHNPHVEDDQEDKREHARLNAHYAALADRIAEQEAQR